MKRPFIISGTGCALIDYLYKPVSFTDDGFRKYLSHQAGDGGLTPGELVFTEEFEKFSKEPYSTIRGLITRGKEPVGLNIGGPSIVSLIHAAQMLHGMDAEVYFSGSKGNDDGGRFIEEKLKATPLKVSYYKTGSNYTPFTDVLSDPGYDGGLGERIFINNIGAAWEFMPGDLDSQFFRSDIVVFGGTALVPNIHQALGELLCKAKQNKALTIVNTVYDFLSEKSDPLKPWSLGRSTESYQHIDLLITDMEEALRLSGATNAEAAIYYFKQAGVGAAVITHGPKPIHFFAQNNLFGHIPASTLPVSSRITAELLIGNKNGDTTGCGDNFAGGLTAAIAIQLIKGKEFQLSFTEAIALGVVSGGFACFYNGGTYFESYPGEKAEKIQGYYNDYRKQIMSENGK
jgi:sugar/nucleoside kinase (ribokinase family)